MAEHQVQREHGETKGRFVIRKGGEEAELTYSVTTPTLIIADHTGVPDSMAGKGVARALLDYMLEDARKSGFRIIPVCPYVRGQYARHPEWAPLFTTAPGEDP